MPCKKLHQLNDWQVNQLRKHIQDNQWFLGEKYNHSVDWQTAECDFIVHHLQRVAIEMRQEFCHNYCPLSADCSLIDLFTERDLATSEEP